MREVMSREVARIEVGKSVFAAAHMMLTEGVSSVVVTKNDEVVGIVNRLDLYAAIEGLDAGGEYPVGSAGK
ncbi:MAG: CBS domain-containing protein [Rubrobacter sp.]|nr:CBS domain-containing protein [Rubrobacter sp.]